MTLTDAITLYKEADDYFETGARPCRYAGVMPKYIRGIYGGSGVAKVMLDAAAEEVFKRLADEYMRKSNSTTICSSS